MDQNLKCYYNIHDLVKIEISQNEFDLTTNFNHYFRHFEINTEPPDVNYKIKEFSEFILPKIHFKAGENFVGLENGIYLPLEQYAIVFENNQIIEYTNIANRATNLWLQCFLIQKNMSLIHSAAVNINGNGIIFPAFGGAGKTILISELRKLEKFQFFGDDYVIVDEKSNMYSYPLDFSIYPYHLSLFKEIENTKAKEYFERRAKRLNLFQNIIRIPGINMMYHLVKNRMSNPKKPVWDMDYFKVSASQVIPQNKIGTFTKINTCVFLKRYTGTELKIEKMPHEALVKEIIGILHMEFQYSILYLHLLAAFNIFDITEFEIRQKRIIEKCFLNLDLYQVLIPINISAGDYTQKIVEFVNELGHE